MRGARDDSGGHFDCWRPGRTWRLWHGVWLEVLTRLLLNFLDGRSLDGLDADDMRARGHLQPTDRKELALGLGLLHRRSVDERECGGRLVARRDTSTRWSLAKESGESAGRGIRGLGRRRSERRKLALRAEARRDLCQRRKGHALARSVVDPLCALSLWQAEVNLLHPWLARIALLVRQHVKVGERRVQARGREGIVEDRWGLWRSLGLLRGRWGWRGLELGQEQSAAFIWIFKKKELLCTGLALFISNTLRSEWTHAAYVGAL
jgi:hypothetical protein